MRGPMIIACCCSTGNIRSKGATNFFQGLLCRMIYSGQLRMGLGRGVGGPEEDLFFIDGLILNDLSTTCHNLSALQSEEKSQYEFTLISPPRIFINHPLL